jgi:hypothetical protein
LEQLERYVRNIKILLFVGLLGVIASIFFGRYALASAPDEKILHVRGIVNEDATGHPRMLIGAPVSNQGRKRKDELSGLVMLGDDGTDRLTIAADVQINGKIEPRLAKGVGFLLPPSRPDTPASYR